MKKNDAVTTAGAHEKLRDEFMKLTDAMVNGRLSERGDVRSHDRESAELVGLVNKMIDVLVAPLKMMASSIDEIAHGRIPGFIIDEYKGDYGDIKRNLNTLLATLYGMHHETNNLISAIKEGKLDTRGNDWDFEGNWNGLIAGVNGTLDAVLNPLVEARGALEQLSEYDLGARIKGKYRGDHAIIKRALNQSAGSLESAIGQVASSVETVTAAGRRISEGSQKVAHGAAEQVESVKTSSENLEKIAISFKNNVQHITEAKSNAEKAQSSIDGAKQSMMKMLEAMSESRAASDSTAAIVKEINQITVQTDGLAQSAARRADKVRSSAGGFGVVASEIRKLSTRCEEAAGLLKKSGIQSGELAQLNEDGDMTLLETIIEDLEDVAKLSNILGINAAIEAAHAEGAGFDFEILTDEVRQLAQNSADAAQKTNESIQRSVALARKGEVLSQEIARQLSKAVEAATAINQFTEKVAAESEEQAVELEIVNQSVLEINKISQQNAETAEESSVAAKELEGQMKALSLMVEKFKFAKQQAAN